MTRFYYTSSDRFLLLSAYEADVPKLNTIEGLEGLADLPKEERAAFLASAFMTARASDWAERLQAADIGGTVCENIESIRAYSARPADGTPGTDRGSYSFSVYEDHPSGHVITQLDPFAIRPAHGKIYALDPAEKFGKSTRIILEELGYDAEAIDGMITDGAVSESWSREYLPS